MKSGNRTEATKMSQALEIVLIFMTKVLGNRRYAKVAICLTLMAFGIKNSEIRSKLGMSYNALRKYKSALESGEIKALFEFSGERNKSELESHEGVILEEFRENPPKTLREAVERIKKMTKVERSVNRVRIWLKKRS
jgi:transposase